MGCLLRTLIGRGCQLPLQGLRPDMKSGPSGSLGRSGMDAAQRSSRGGLSESAVRSRVRRCQIERSRRQGCRSGSDRRAAASFRSSAHQAPLGRSVGRSNPHRFRGQYSVAGLTPNRSAARLVRTWMASSSASSAAARSVAGGVGARGPPWTGSPLAHSANAGRNRAPARSDLRRILTHPTSTFPEHACPPRPWPRYMQEPARYSYNREHPAPDRSEPHAGQ